MRIGEIRQEYDMMGMLNVIHSSLIRGTLINTNH